MKTNAIIRIILLSLTLVVLLGILGAGILVRTYMVNHNDGSTGNLPVAHDGTVNQGVVGSEIRNIEIDWVSGSITLIPDPECSDIIISETGNIDQKYQMVYSTSGDKLKIQYCKDSFHFPSFGININNDINKDLVITVPGDWNCNVLEIDTASAWVQVNDLSISEFSFNGASGYCTISNCDVDRLDLDTASGDVRFDGSLNHLDCDAASANCIITVSNKPESIEIDTASGNLELTLPEDCGFVCEMDTLSGHFESDFDTTSHNGRHIYGDSHCSININGMSGDVAIRKHHGIAASAAIPYCTDPDCTDSSHDHSGICTDENCTDASHNHSGTCTDNSCNDSSHGHNDHH